MFRQDQCFSPIVMKFVNHTSSVVEDCSCIYYLISTVMLDWMVGDAVGDMKQKSRKVFSSPKIWEIFFFSESLRDGTFKKSILNSKINILKVNSLC